MKMKISVLFAALLLQTGPRYAPLINYTDDLPFSFNLSDPTLKIIQFADLHLTYGFDKHDKMSLKLIDTIVKREAPDLVVFTGDQTLSLEPLRLYKKLILHMEKLQTPWTFILGNHDYDYTTKAKLLRQVERVNANYLYFKVGPKLDEDNRGGNFVFNYYYNDLPFYNLYFLDSGDELVKREKDDLSRYKSLTSEQVSWYKEKALRDQNSNIYSSVFMHIPLPQYLQIHDPAAKDSMVGELRESVYAQSKDTFFFDAMVEARMSQAVFVGHDHRNNFSFTYNDILLAYGQSSGYNGYGGVKRGARVINISAPGGILTLDTYVTFEDSL